MKKNILIILMLILVPVVKADQIKSSTFGPGKEVKNSNYTLNGSASQVHTGEASGSGFKMKIGFWNGARLLAMQPSITTLSVRILGDGKIRTGGFDINDGGDSITAKGICWNTSGSPTLSDNFILVGDDDSDYQAIASGFVVNQQYYVRAYATNSSGTAYGNEISFVYYTIPTLPEWGLIIFGGLIVVFAVRKIIFNT